MDQREEKINTLLEDNRFVDWVNNPESAYAEYWRMWIDSCAENAMLAEAAKGFILHVRETSQDAVDIPDQSSIDGMWDQIHGSIIAHDAGVETVVAGRRGRWRWAAAAIVAALVVFGGLLFVKQNGSRQLLAQKKGQDTLSSELVRYNGSAKNALVFLPDGSKVTLARGARIAYNRLMSGTKREISLTGEAFFDVAKNPDKPFYIYTQKMVVKVLGTSFRVITSAQQEAVLVKTGKVSVYLKGQEQQGSAGRIVLPRQACRYSTSGKELVTTACRDKDKIELETDGDDEYAFEDAPIDAVFKTLEKMYALPILYDRATFANCFINISLGDERLEDKLEVITQTINASYSLSDKGIIIEGKGCK
jgi:ferric-dicitrate binding protein FerR (iron transport regulator)